MLPVGDPLSVFNFHFKITQEGLCSEKTDAMLATSLFSCASVEIHHMAEHFMLLGQYQQSSTLE